MENVLARCKIKESRIKAVYVLDYLHNSLWVDVREFKELQYEQRKIKLIELYGGLDNKSSYYQQHRNLEQKLDREPMNSSTECGLQCIAFGNMRAERPRSKTRFRRCSFM